MSNKISFPFDNMRQVAQQIISESETLASESASRIQQLNATNSSLPASMQGNFSELFGQIQRNMSQVLALRLSIGQTLVQAADLAQATEQAIDAPLSHH